MSFDGLKHWAMTHPKFILAVQIPIAVSGVCITATAPMFDEILDSDAVLKFQCVGLAIFAAFTFLTLNYGYQKHKYQQRLNEIRRSQLNEIRMSILRLELMH